MFRIRTPVFVLLCGAATVGCSAQWLSDPDFDRHTEQGIEEVYNLRFDKAEAEFNQLVRMHPRHPAGHFLLAMVDWWRILIDIENESLDDRFVSALEGVISVCDSILSERPDDVTALFFKGGALGFRGRLRANRESWIRAANDGRLALPIVQRAFAIAPDNQDILLGMGIYNYYADVIPEEYPIVKPLLVFFPKGDRAKGIAQLTAASQRAQYASIEATYFLLQLYYTYEHQYEMALGVAERLLGRFPRNVVFHRYVGRCQVLLGRWGSACSVFDEILARCDSVEGQWPGYGPAARREALYYLGVCAMNRASFAEALALFYRCDELCRSLDKNGESGFMTMVNLKIGMVYDLQSKRSLAVEQYRKVLRMKEYQTSHTSAEQYLATPYGR